MQGDRLEELFHDLLEAPEESRRERLTALGQEDPGLRDELAALLEAFLSSPAFLVPTEERGTPVRLGKYSVEQEIGRGGSGIVYRARDPDLDRSVAAKILTRSALPGRRGESLRREARLLAGVSHPNVAQAYSVETVETDAGQTVTLLTMEWVPGESLARKLSGGGLPLEVCLDYGRQIAAALEAAHGSSVIHRDLKPQNVRVTPEGWVKILDFGLAHLLSAHLGPAEAAADSTPSRWAGTPGYMSPEQSRGEPVDARCDLWGFGCILQECFSGEPAIRGRTVSELLEETRLGHVHADLPAYVPPAVRGLLRECLEPDPQRRLVSATSARRVLEEELLRVRARAFFRPAELEMGEAPAPHGGNLPRPWSSFVGRADLLAELEGALGRRRLLTLTGPGGVGKTRTGLEAAARSGPLFPGGRWFVDLAAVSQGTDVAVAVSRSLGLRDVDENRPDTLARGMAAAFGGKSGLVVLDNCEHVVEGAARFVETLLSASPLATVLATSRQPLGLPGEQVVPVPALDLPREPSLLAQAENTEDQAEVPPESEAIRLFLERARSRAPAFPSSNQALGAIAEICRRLDGLPLAIELAASQTRALSVDELLRRLREGRELPESTSPGRHRSLRHLVDWSHALLSERERALFRRLSVFRGGWTLDAAEAVCGGWDGIESWEVCDLLTRLVERSLAEPEVFEAEKEGHGPARYRLLETIRAFAADRLRGNPGEEQTTRERYLRFLETLAVLRTEERRASHSEWVRRIGPDYANLVHGLELALVRGDLAAAFALGERMADYWVQTGLWTEGIRWMDRLLASRDASPRPPSAPDAGTEVKVLSQAGLLAVLVRQPDKAQPVIEEALERGAALGEPGPLALAHETAGVAASHRGDLQAAQTHFEQSRSFFEESADPGGAAICIGNLGVLQSMQGRHEPALNLYREHLRLSREMRDRLSEAKALTNIGWTATTLGLFEEARSSLEEALAIHDAHGDAHGAGVVHRNLGDLHLNSGAPEAARLHSRKAGRLFLRIGDPAGVAAAILTLARLADREGFPVLAAEALAGLLRTIESAGVPFRPEALRPLREWRDDLEQRIGVEEMAKAADRGAARDMAGLFALVDIQEEPPPC